MKILLSLTLLFGLAIPLYAEERPLFLPFDLHLDEHKATMKPGNELFAQVDQPIKANAVLSIENPSAMLIVNAFPCAEDGTVNQAQPAAVIFANNTREVKLDQTLDKKPLAPGTYLANVVAHNQTARVVFQVGEPKAAIDFSKVFSFLKKKAGGE